jgi:putative membrane protein
LTARWHLLVSALLLGLANAVIKPLIVGLTFPLTMLSFGLFLLVINALMLWLVAKLVSGFRLDGFGTAFWASIFISLLSLLLGGFVLEGSPEYTIPTGPDAASGCDHSHATARHTPHHVPSLSPVSGCRLMAIAA